VLFIRGFGFGNPHRQPYTGFFGDAAPLSAKGGKLSRKP
jgi:hypothetical protein